MASAASLSVPMREDGRAGYAAALSLLLVLGMLAMLISVVRDPDYVKPLPTPPVLINPQTDPAGHAAQARMQQIQQRFEQGVAMLHAKQYDHALTALHKVLELSPRLVEGHVNMGYALLGLKRYAAARDFFNTAIELKPYQANAYWGLAVTSHELGDLPAALGAMRAYLHLSPPEDPFVRKARAAIWEIESALGRGPLPQEEQDFLARGAKQWQDRNSSQQDRPPPHNETPQPLELTPLR